MPHTAKMVDEIRKVIPDIKVIYAEEGNYKLGKPLGSAVVPHLEEKNDTHTHSNSRITKRKSL